MNRGEKMSKQKEQRITKLSFTPTILDNFIDTIENKDEINEQLKADLCIGGINTEIRTQVIDELIDRLNKLIPNIIIATHE